MCLVKKKEQEKYFDIYDILKKRHECFLSNRFCDALSCGIDEAFHF
jgi:hypothetical protein